MDEGSSYCCCGCEIKNMSDAAKITNMVMTGAGGKEICLEKDSVESKMKPIFLADRLDIIG